MKRIRTVIIDDERSARNEIAEQLAAFNDFELCGLAQNAGEARQLIKLQKPDLLFLDIQMPAESGFELLESLLVAPEVIFVTAYDHYAVRAFEVNAWDYLLKPVREERFEMALHKFKSKWLSGHRSPQVCIRDKGQRQLVRWDEIHLITSMDNYACLHLGEKKLWLKTSLNQLEMELDRHMFFRINRAEIINTAFIHKISPAEKGRLMVTLTGGQTLGISDRQSARFRKFYS